MTNLTTVVRYLQMFYNGNPAAFWLMVSFLALSAVIVWTTPFCDAEFDAYMQEYEEAKALNEELRRAA